MFAVVDTVSVAGGGGGTVTTGAIDTTGSTLIVIVMTNYDAAAVLSDSKSNTWTALSDQLTGHALQQLHYCITPTVGSGHTFTATVSGAPTYPMLGVIAFSSGITPVFDVDGVAFASGMTGQPGSLLSSEDGAVFVAGICADSFPDTSASISGINQSFVLQESFPYGVGQQLISGIASLIQTSAGSQNPTWTLSNTADLAMGMAVFVEPTTPVSTFPSLLLCA